MTARLREEMLAGKPVHTAVAEAVRRVAPAVAAAGLVVASSFGALMLESAPRGEPDPTWRGCHG